MNENLGPVVLRTVPREKAFYFFTSFGNYTGESASSLKEFLGKIDEVNLKSLEFHLFRGDFEKWIADVLQDDELASEFRRLQGFRLSGDALKNELIQTISKHLQALVGQSSPP